MFDDGSPLFLITAFSASFNLLSGLSIKCVITGRWLLLPLSAWRWIFWCQRRTGIVSSITASDISDSGSFCRKRLDIKHEKPLVEDTFCNFSCISQPFSFCLQTQICCQLGVSCVASCFKRASQKHWFLFSQNHQKGHSCCNLSFSKNSPQFPLSRRHRKTPSYMQLQGKETKRPFCINLFQK